ncbi:hypothetical protein CTAYLR_000022 [Chrysophaeum taylorii]|uniref:Tr-type G domain-containing protein n=1 Tax=Chrysophaeum taylorii TaxID=2483200 RepID=A0AAD7XM38_9STRA|nr:hypothetical protein CTAYLR_000022 [Chrysophaeum taylorii]
MKKKKGKKIIAAPEREVIRNACVLGHVDHGKSSLADWVVAETGVIPARLAGEIRYLDDLPDEQARGITMRASAVSVVFETAAAATAAAAGVKKKKYLVTLVDSPGHIDFAYDAFAAAKACEGAVVVVDVVEGLRVQSLAALRVVRSEHLAAILVLNKIDRWVGVLEPSEAFEKVSRLVEAANAALGETYFALEKGNVVFSSAKHGWGFTLPMVARVLAAELKVRKESLVEGLSDAAAFVSGRFVKRGASRAPAFVTLVFEPIWAYYSRENAPAHLIITSLREQFPIERATLRAVVDRVPAPARRDEEAVVAYVAKVFSPSPDKFDTLLAFSRCDSAISIGDSLEVVTEEEEKEEGTPTIVEIESIFAMMGASVEPIESAEPGRLVALGPEVPRAMGTAKRAILMKRGGTPPAFPARPPQPPFLEVAVSASTRRDEPALDAGLALLKQLDAAATVDLATSGDRILGCVGELHLDQCLKDLRERYARVAVDASPPVVGFREGIVAGPPGHQTTLPPWRDELAGLDVSVAGAARLGDVLEIRARPGGGGPLEEEDDEEEVARRGECALVARREVFSRDLLATVAFGFNLAVDSGPLAEEPMRGVEFRVWHLDHDGGPDLVSAAKRCCRAAVLNSSVRVFEPMLECELRCADPEAVGKMYALVSKRRGKVASEEEAAEDYYYAATVALPAIESIGFSSALLEWTSGRATAPSMQFSGYEIVDVDPFWRPATEDEREEHGDAATFAPNRPRRLINATRQRKGLPTELKLVRESAEKL